jgi:hypothetical protein
MAFPSEGAYGVPKGLVYGYPVTVKNGQVEIVKGLEINAFSRAKMDATAKELEEERDAVKQLGLICHRFQITQGGDPLRFCLKRQFRPRNGHDPFPLRRKLCFLRVRFFGPMRLS